MNHVIIFLFNKYGHVESDIEPIYKSLLKLNVTGEKKFFLLDIGVRGFAFQTDSLYEYRQENNLTDRYLVQDSLNLRSKADLKRAFELIKNLTEPAKYYFISSGHGFGAGISRVLRDVINRLKWLIRHFSNAPILRNTGENYSDDKFDDITWNIELRDALGTFKPNLQIIVFNHCLINFFDSLYFYSSVCKYLVGSETYVSLQMLKPDELFKSIYNSSNLPQSQLANIIFDQYKNGLSEERRTSRGLEDASLFLIDLDVMQTILNQFNFISGKLITVYPDSKSLNRFLHSLENQYIDKPNRLFDMVSFLNSVIQKHPTLKSDIDPIIHNIKSVLVIQKEPGLEQNKIHGVSIFLPEVKDDKRVLTDKFKMYFDNYPQELRTFDWYQFLRIP